MSYSEWISTYSVGGRGSKLSNMRVQESGSLSDADDPQALAVYSIVYGDDDVTYNEQLHGYENDRTIIEVRICGDLLSTQCCKISPVCRKLTKVVWFFFDSF